MTFKKFTDNQKQEFAAEYSRGITLQTLATRAEVSVPTMAKYVRAGGGVVRKQGSSYRKTPAVSTPVPTRVEELIEEPVFTAPEPTPAPVVARVFLPVD